MTGERKARAAAAGIDLLIVFFFAVLWLISSTGGVVVELFGATVKATHIKNPLAAITFLWIVRRLFFSGAKRPFLKFTAAAVFFTLAAVLFLFVNTVVTRQILRSGETAGEGRAGLRGGTASAGGRRDWNVILISVDTLRADHLGCYGYGEKTSPAIDALAAEGVRFEDHAASATSTLPSHGTILTSLYPSVHKAEVSTKTSLGEEVLTLPEVFRDSGYATASFNGGGQLSRSYRLDQGFDVYDDAGGGAAAVFDRASRYVEEHAAAPFFLFLHTYEPHHPYDPPPPFDTRFYPEYRGRLGREITIPSLERINNGSIEASAEDLRHIVAQYDGEIAHTDEVIRLFFEGLKRAGLWEKTVILFTSDHGEEFGEHGIVGWHAHTLYEELLKVPLILRLPDGEWAGRVVTEPTGSVDVFPTLLDALGLKVPQGLQGISLLPLLREGEGRRFDLPLYSERESIFSQRSLRIGGEKLIAEGNISVFEKRLAKFFIFSRKAYSGMEYYNLDDDPVESRNLFTKKRGGAFALEGRLAKLLEENSLLAEHVTAGEADVDDELNEKLKALGYLR